MTDAPDRISPDLTKQQEMLYRGIIECAASFEAAKLRVTKVTFEVVPESGARQSGVNTKRYESWGGLFSIDIAVVDGSV